LAENLKTTPSLKESELQEAVMRAPESVEANRQLGQFLATNGRAAEAVPYLERASHLSPGDAELHHLLASVDEKVGNPLQAVRQYQRAAELKSSETNLFDWGTELLSHRALEPATEVFSKGNRLYPKSVRMLVALGVAWYARGSYDQAAQCLISASDVNPDDPAPYLFLGRMQSVQAAPLQGAVERLARFAEMQPNNALANYNYAVALWKQSVVAADSAGEKEVMARIAQLLEKALQLDPNLAAAYLQLGILDSHLGDFPHATAALQKAIETSLGPDATLAEAHYRLAQIYERTGDKTKAHQELELHTLIATQARNSSDRERQQVQEFVISLKNNPAENPAP
jgi:tetratricopeptide (TPR) repeat protein